jgi:Ser/Thr protein kinase RdoA (MazF antagonist)
MNEADHPEREPGTTPYSELTPDRVLDAVESVGLQTDGRLLALNSFENRVFQIGIEDAQPVVAKFYRPGRWSDDAILEEHAFLHELVQAEIPVVEPLTFGGDRTLLEFAGFRFTVFPRRGGRAPEFEDLRTLEWLGRFLGRIHAVGASKPFRHRPALTVETFGTEPRDWLLAHDFLPRELRSVWEGVVNHALDGVRRCYERAGDAQTLRLHGDCHAGNILWTDAGPHFVDFDDCRTGPAVQDLWMLLSGDREDMTRQLSAVLDGYEEFAEFNPRELNLVEALRTLRLIHFSGWIARRWEDPAFPAAFPWFGTQHYWQDRILELREQIALMNEAPLNVSAR